MPEGTVPIHISINGSRAKGYNMEDSPYSIKVISMASQKEYALGNEKKTYGIRT
jgi:predicted nucleotidyltransferase